MAVSFLGLTIGDNGTGFVVPTLAQWREAFAVWVREKRGIDNLQTQPGSLYGIFIDICTQAVDIAGGAALDVVSRMLFTSMEGVLLDQFIADYMQRVVDTASTATVYVYGTAGAVVAASTPVRTSAVGTPFAFLGAVALPVAPATAYGVEVSNFAAGAYVGQNFTVTVDGTPAVYVANGSDTGATVRTGLVAAVMALAQPQTAYFAGSNPKALQPTLVVVDLADNTFPLTVSGPVGAGLTAYVARSGGTDTGAVLGPTFAPAGSLRVGTTPAGVQGFTNITAAVPGRVRESNSQLRARYQVLQRGRGGGNPDAIKAIILSPVEVGGGGALFCNVEYNPMGDNPDAAGNVDHSVRVIIGVDDDGPAAAKALLTAKAAGDNTNGPEVYNVTDNGVPPATQVIRIDRLTNLWIAVDVQVSVGPDWPNTGNPLTQLRQDIADYVESLQPSLIGVRVQDLPIALTPDGLPRGVLAFFVRIGSSTTQGGTYTYGPYYPIPEADATVASVAMSNRQKARAQVADITAIIV